MHWGVEAELIRRGGFRKRKTMIKGPVVANASIDDLRDKNHKGLGEQKLDTSKSAGKIDLFESVYAAGAQQ